MGWGDEIMAAGRARVAHARTGGRVAILDRLGQPRTHAAWERNPIIARPGETYEAGIVDGPHCRPYIASYDNHRWVWREYGPVPGALHFSPDEHGHALSALGTRRGFILVEPNVKPRRESMNKDWGFARWQALVQRHRDWPWLQVGPIEARRLRGADFIVTADFRAAAAVLVHAGVYVGTEGGLHHAAAALGVPAVVIFGGFIGPRVTGYETHRNLFEGGTDFDAVSRLMIERVSTSTPHRARGDADLGCGWRVTCPHCQAALSRITVEKVASEIESLLHVKHHEEPVT